MESSYVKAIIRGCPIPKRLGSTDYYSQAFEDYILGYVFKDTENGFFVDVGAFDPYYLSVTHYFHLRNWLGMNIEPQKDLYENFLKYRPDDINVQAAAGDKAGEALFFVPKNKELGTFDKQQADYLGNYEAMSIQIRRLDDILKQFDIKHIDFLKVDTENYEYEVLKGLDMQTYRPLVQVVEYIMTGKANLAYEELLFENGYVLASDDFLNRYYYREESPELAERFEFINNCIIDYYA